MAGPDDCTTTDLNCRNHLNQFFIEDALDDDNSVVRLSSQTMDKMELFCGDTVKLKGKKRRETICIVLSDDTCQDDRIRVNHVTQNNLRVHSGDLIVIQGCQHVKYGKRIHVLPIDDTVKDITNNLLQEYLQSYFLDAYRPVCVGDTFTIRTAMPVVEFKVIETEPSPYCIVAPETVIHCQGEPIKREAEEALINEIGFDDIGGLEGVKQKLKEFIQYPIEHLEIYHKFGMAPSRGVLLYGPPGCGKTMLVKALANECNINLISINGCELLSMSLNNIEDSVRDIFDKARQTAPCILFIDELDCMDHIVNCRHGNAVTHQYTSTDRVINQLLTEIDGISVRRKVFIIGATNRPDMIDRTILRPGRLDQMIYVPLPDEKARLAIIKIVLKKWPVAKDVDLTYLAKVLVGENGAGVAEICRRACKAAIRESIENKQKIDWPNPDKDSNVADPMDVIRRDHFEKAMSFRGCFAVSDIDIRKYEMFAQMWRSPCGYDSSFRIFNYPQNLNEGGGVTQGSPDYTDDDDLYT